MSAARGPGRIPSNNIPDDAFDHLGPLERELPEFRSAELTELRARFGFPQESEKLLGLLFHPLAHVRSKILVADGAWDRCDDGVENKGVESGDAQHEGAAKQVGDVLLGPTGDAV